VILLVEDDPNDEALTLRAFKKVNVANPLVVVRDGQEALDWLFREGSHANRPESLLPAVVLLDLKLPVVDGLEVLRRLREVPATRQLPVVILTASNEESDLVRGYDLGVNSFIRKPVDFEQFVGAVAQIGLYWLLLNELPLKAP
jgi:two-component system response regulator